MQRRAACELVLCIVIMIVLWQWVYSFCYLHGNYCYVIVADSENWKTAVALAPPICCRATSGWLGRHFFRSATLGRLRATALVSGMSCTKCAPC